MHVHLGGSGAHRTAAAASSTRPQHGRTAEAAASPAAAARCSRGRRSAAAGGCCGGAASCGGGLAAQPMSGTRHQHMSPGAAPTSKHLHCTERHPLTSPGFQSPNVGECTIILIKGNCLSSRKCTMGRFADTRRFGQGAERSAHFTCYDSPTSGEQNKKTRSFNFNVHFLIRPTANVIF
jgi:hypothetical protein